MINLFNEKSALKTVNYQEFTEGVPFVIAAVIVLFLVPSDTKQENTKLEQGQNVIEYRNPIERAFDGIYYYDETVHH